MWGHFLSFQPKLTDEEGWKRFCLGEKVYLGTTSGLTAAEEEPALDYRKVVLLLLTDTGIKTYSNQ